MEVVCSKQQNLIQKIKSWLVKLSIRFGSQDASIQRLLGNVYLFDKLTSEQKILVTKSIQPIYYESGEVIFKQNAEGDNFYLIKSGVVSICFFPPEGNAEIVLARLEAGDFFGEQALLGSLPEKRNASAKTLTKTTLYAISHSVYQKILNANVAEILKKIGERELLENLDKNLEAFGLLKNDLGEVLNYSDGQVIFKAREIADRSYFILSGEVVIEFPGQDASAHRTELGAGELFGELGVLEQIPRAGTARARGSLRLLSFKGDAFRKLYKESSELQRFVRELKDVYPLLNQGTVRLYHSKFLNLKSINANYHLGDNRLVTTSKVIGMPIFAMSHNELGAAETVHFARGADIRRRLMILGYKILGVSCFGEWDELGEVCGLILQQKKISDEQIESFKKTGKLNLSKFKILPSEQRNETICFCMKVSKGTIYDAMSQGVNNLSDMIKKTGAGSVCGTCQPRIVELLGMQAWTAVRFIEKVPLTSNICSFRFLPTDLAQYRYQPGQHIVIQAMISGQFVSRSYTLTSVPDRDHFIEITVKRESQGAFSNWLFDQANESSLIRISQPRGDFVLTPEPDVPMVCFVGGIGVTPALAFARYLVAHSKESRLHIDYSCKTDKDFILTEEWKSMTAAQKNITIQLRATADNHRLSEDAIDHVCGQLKGCKFYICGPKDFEQFVVNYLKKCQISTDRIRVEEFIHAGSPVSRTIEI